jgi:ABC-type antimicrobial peptide transport system permease subunit
MSSVPCRRSPLSLPTVLFLSTDERSVAAVPFDRQGESGVRPLDLATFVFVTIVLGVIAAFSIVGSAWHATRIDPAVALRNR